MALVLIVDDDPFIVEMLADVVTEYGHAVVSAANGADALKRALATPPALIISDVMMPVMDGYALLHAVRDTPALQHTPIFLMSAAFSAQHLPQLNPAPEGFVPKPFRLDVIESLLESLQAGPAHE